MTEAPFRYEAGIGEEVRNGRRASPYGIPPIGLNISGLLGAQAVTLFAADLPPVLRQERVDAEISPHRMETTDDAWTSHPRR
jgi:hypothetical protein